MELYELQVFLTVATEQSFSRAAAKLHRTQPAVSQTVRRLESTLGERLFDRTSKQARLTAAGHVLQEYAQQLMRLAGEAESAVKELRDLQRGRVLVGSNEGAIHSLLPVIARFRVLHPQVLVDVRRVRSRQIGVEVLQGGLDCGVLTFQPAEQDLMSITIGSDDLVLLAHPTHPLARRKQISLDEFARQTVIAHSDPSPTRDRVLRLFEQRHEPINIQMALPSLDAIKRAVEMGLGVALLPRRCAVAELARGTLVAILVPQVGLSREVRLVYRHTGEHSHALAALLEVAKEFETQTTE